MIKKNKGLVITTTLVCLLPVLAGLLLWNRLPEQIPSHWNYQGVIDGWSSKCFTVFFIPLLILAMHWVCLAVTAIDPRSENISAKSLALVLWISPVMSVVVGTLMYGTALGMEMNVDRVMPMAMGLLFVIIGNYLPKCRQNYSIGIKVPWTLHNEDNWNATHRFGGRLWVVGGLVTLAAALLGYPLVIFPVLPTLGLAPMVYSYLYYKKHS